MDILRKFTRKTGFKSDWPGVIFGPARSQIPYFLDRAPSERGSYKATKSVPRAFFPQSFARELCKQKCKLRLQGGYHLRAKL